MRRYLLLGTGLSSTAVGLALIVSVVAAASAESDDSVAVSQIFGRASVSTLDVVPYRLTAEFEAVTSGPDFVDPAPIFDLTRPENTQAFRDAVEQGVPLAPPPATELDPSPTAATEPEPTVTPPHPRPLGMIEGVNITFYDCLVQGFCGHMFNGQQVYEGAAACSWDLPIGTRFYIEGDPTGRIYICLDRGLLADTWVDVFFHSPTDGWDWQRSVGRYSTIFIISVPIFDEDDS